MALTLQSDNERHFEVDVLAGVNDAVGDRCAVYYAAKDVYQYGLDLRVGCQYAEGFLNLLLINITANIFFYLLLLSVV